MTLPALLEERVAALTRGPAVDWVLAVALAGVAGAYVRAIGFTPLDRAQGAAQKIYYLHPQAAIAAYMAIGIMAVFSILYLWIRDDRFDQLAEASGEVALLFISVVLVTGTIWAKPVWDAWWTWEVRLTSTLALFLVMVGYLAVRATIDEPTTRGRYSAALAVVAILLIPFIHVSVYAFRHLHPEPTMIALPDLGRPDLPPAVRTSFLLSTAVFGLLGIAFIRARFRLGMQRATLAVLEGAR